VRACVCACVRGRVQVQASIRHQHLKSETVFRSPYSTIQCVDSSEQDYQTISTRF